MTCASTPRRSLRARPLITAALLLAAMAAGPSLAQDPLARLGTEISAVIDPQTAPRLILIQNEHGVANLRGLGVGDVYADGWVLTAVTATNVTLSRGGESRTVAVRAAVQPPAPVQPQVVMNAPPQPVRNDNRPPPPRVNAFAQVVSLARASVASVEDLRKLDSQASAEDAPVPVGMSAIGQAQLENLRRYGGGVNEIPPRYSLQVNGAIWMADGGFIPPGMSNNVAGAITTYGNASPGGPGLYGSATSYSVNGETITIQKAMQIGAYTMVVRSLQVRSGQTATIRLPDGSIFSVTPTLVPQQALFQPFP